MNIVWLDPSVENRNAGDEIISSSIASLDLPGLDSARRITTHRLLSWEERRALSNAELVVFGGTNALSSHMERFRQWPVDPDLARRIRGKVLLLGVGWWQYQGSPCRYTRLLWNTILSREVPHALRDRYSHSRLSEMGIPASFTGCPTMWGLQDTVIQPLGRSRRVVVTVTDYKPAPELDRTWLAAAARHYEKVTLVGMGPGDQGYWESIGSPGEWGGYGTPALRRHLPAADFVGTRLHAGIFAVALDRPALVLSVDNRAAEIGATTGLPVAPRADIGDVLRRFSGVQTQTLCLPTNAIQDWRTRFVSHVVGSSD